MEIFCRLVITASLFGASVPLHAQDSIGINFGADRDGAALAPTDIAGVTPRPNWNNAGGAFGGPIELVDNEGSPTTAEVTWETDEEWSIADPTDDANGILLKGWISANNFDTPDATVDITGIPFENYTLYIYYNHDRATEDVDIFEENGAFPLFRAQENDTDITVVPVNFVEQLESAELDDTQVGNYVRFTGLTSATLNIILEPAGDQGSVDRGAITGIQIYSSDGNAEGDDDGDGLLNEWELSNDLDPDDNGLNPNNNGIAGNPDNGAEGDPDSDGSPNLREQAQRSNPRDPDTDGDTLLDGVETGDMIFVSASATGTDPLMRDSDGDTLEDNVEDGGGLVVDPATMTGTDPNKADTDSDLLRDDWEIANMLSPFDDGSTLAENGAAGNPDDDGSPNSEEQDRGTDPRLADTDGDSLSDGVETGDGNYIGAGATGTDPLNADTDGDTLTDDVENNSGVYSSLGMTGTDPSSADTDGDLLRDDWEIDNARNPFDPSDTEITMGAIGMNFGAARGNAFLEDFDVAGVYAQPNWNNLEFEFNDGDNQPLVDATGSSSGANVAWDFDEEWSMGGAAPADANGILLEGWVSSNGIDGNLIEISDIPYTAYDLVVYINHDRNFEETKITETRGAFPPFRLRENNPNIVDGFTFTQQVESNSAANLVSGNFVVFPNLTAPSLGLLISEEIPAEGGRAPVSGIQLIGRPFIPDFEITAISADLDAATVDVTWSSVAGSAYQLEVSTDLDAPGGGWVVISDTNATGTTSSFQETGVDFTADPVRFYRVRALPPGAGAR